MELLFVAVYTSIWFGAGWLIGQNVFYRKMERKLPGLVVKYLKRQIKGGVE